MSISLFTSESEAVIIRGIVNIKQLRLAVKMILQQLTSLHPFTNADTLQAASSDMAEGIERALAHTCGDFSFGNQFTMAEIYLIPQCYNAERFGVSLDDFPGIKNIYVNCLQKEFSKKAHADSFDPSKNQ